MKIEFSFLNVISEMNFDFQVQTLIKDNQDFFSKLINENFSKLFNKFVYNYYSTKLESSPEDVFEIYNNIEYLNEYFGLPFKNIDEMKQLGKSFYYDNESVYEIKFKSEAELFIDGMLIESLNKLFNH